MSSARPRARRSTFRSTSAARAITARSAIARSTRKSGSPASICSSTDGVGDATKGGLRVAFLIAHVKTHSPRQLLRLAAAHEVNRVLAALFRAEDERFIGL